MAEARAHVFIKGRVQGVSFRYYTMREAERQRLMGWVRNLMDGRVEAVFEGDRDRVEAALDWCRQGPPQADVAGVHVSWNDYTGEFKGFNIAFERDA